jgi:hypothetical protein
MKPADIWALALRSGSYSVPKLRISSLSMTFASAIVDLDLDLHQHSSIESEEQSSDSKQEQSDFIEESAIMDKMHPVLTSNLPAIEFPLLCSLGIHSERHMDFLIQEIMKFHK